MKKYAVIMAGGVGTRFWPQSREHFPKQFLKLFGNRSLIQQTIDRISSFIPFENILVITNQKYIPIVQDQLPELPIGNILGEPIAKNTAPCVALASEIIFQRDENAVMCVLPADHIIKNESLFIEILQTAFEKADQSDGIVTIGIKPTHPETGYGYIHFDKETYSSHLNHDSFSVFGFKEKPNSELAQTFVDAGDYLWNSGMFIWSNQTIRKAFQDYQPKMFALAEQTLSSKNGQVSTKQLESFFTECESISVDYAIMEQAKHVFVVPGDFGWNDVGSWSAVYDLHEKDGDGNVNLTHVSSLVNTKNSFVSSSSGKLIALVGLTDTAVIETDDAILICNLNASQDVKKIVESLINEKKNFK